MTMYHIRRSGEPGVCKAKTPESCPLGGIHTEDHQRAEVIAEAMNENPEHSTLDGSVFFSSNLNLTHFVLDENGEKHYVAPGSPVQKDETLLRTRLAKRVLDRLRDDGFRLDSSGDDINDYVDLDAASKEYVLEVNGNWFIKNPDQSAEKGRMENELMENHGYGPVEILHRVNARHNGEKYDPQSGDKPSPELVRIRLDELEKRVHEGYSELSLLSAKEGQMLEDLRGRVKNVLYPAGSGRRMPTTPAVDHLKGAIHESCMNRNFSPIQRLDSYRVNYARTGEVHPEAKKEGYKDGLDLFNGDKGQLEQMKRIGPLLRDYRGLRRSVLEEGDEVFERTMEIGKLRNDALKVFGTDEEADSKYYEFFAPRDWD